jgi:hypothetical protein
MMTLSEAPGVPEGFQVEALLQLPEVTDVLVTCANSPAMEKNNIKGSNSKNFLHPSLKKPFLLLSKWLKLIESPVSGSVFITEIADSFVVR